MNPHDPFLVTAKEKFRFEQQFNALGPINGFVTGVQAKDFFLKSGLSPLILGQIWALADTDADGKMNIIEFSIACKLISSKLRNVDVPKQLPPTLLASLQHIGTPIRTPTGTMSPTEGYKQFLTQQPYTNAQQQPQIQPPQQQIMPQATTNTVQMMTQQQYQPQPIIQNQQPLIMQSQPNIVPMMNQGIITTAAQPVMIPQQTMPVQQVMMTQAPQQMIVQPQPIIQPQQIPQVSPIQSAVQIQPTVMQQPPLMTSQPTAAIIPPVQPVIPQLPVVPKPPSIEQLSNSSLLDSLAQVQAPLVANIPAAPTPTPPQSGHASRSMSFSEKVPSVPESPAEWAIPQSSKLKYTQMFNAADKSRTGFLTGTQARGILLQTNVPHNILAKIWALSDRDSDGRLGCEEFVLALYLCEMYSTGKPIPTELPNDLIPPSFRKVTSRQGSLAGSRHGSVSSQGVAADIDTMSGLAGMSQSSFEDKRKENYDKGQAELERRRKALADMQRKEQEERERKEREEADKREKARLEAELKKQQEIEREIQRQKELELEREEQRKRELEKKELARKEMEKQRQLEWEGQKLQEMEQERQKEQDRLLKLKGHNQTLTIELESLSTKVKELSQKICDTRVAVTNVKTVIDGMRSTRDTCVSEQTLYKSKIKEQNAKLVQLSQDKARLEAKNKINSSTDEQAMFTNKQINIKQLKDKIENLKQEIQEKSGDVNTHNEQKTELRNELQDLITNCEQLYNEYDTARIQVLELRNNRKNDTFTSAWDTAPPTTNSWATETNQNTTEPAHHSVVTNASYEADASNYVRYKAVYEFSARNNDEISFQTGDIIMVLGNQNAEPGWLAGEINGHTGWFPESYAEKCEEEIVEDAVISEAQSIEATIEANTLNGDIIEGELYVACYPYQSAELGDLTFEAGEEVRVIKKEGDWWTGIIGTRSGIFPANYVQPIIIDNNNTDMKNNTLENDLSKMNINGNLQEQQHTPTNAMTAAEEADAKIQADADSEVSQINTQNVTNDASMQEFRGMTSSASLKAKKGEVAQVIAPYEATSSEQLSLTKGQLIMIRKKSESGWWEGELQSKGRRRQVGWFPATYVKILAGGRMSGRSTPLSSSKIDLHEAVIDKVQAMYPYRALNDDELSFEPDDIISVTSRDEPDWWKGELNGITGLFPSNYVRAFVSSGKKS
ncbi:intersectin-1 isoform X2 [Chironomus tepperi]|uniref:intersectin-1 isoform X2 n=1 Tax=Chironomus tepperi TaxID=113505 RepID=UPI00391F96A4